MGRNRYSPEFARFLEAERSKAQLGISAFAARLGISPSYYRQIKEGYTPVADRLAAMATAWGADPQEWLRMAGIADDLGGILGEETESAGPDELPILGEIDEHGIIGVGPEGAPDLEGVLRFALRANAASPGSLIQAGDVVHFEVCDTAKRNDHVLIEEADGTRRLVRLVSSDPENRAVRVLPIDAPALPKPIRIEARIVARLTALLKV